MRHECKMASESIMIWYASPIAFRLIDDRTSMLVCDRIERNTQVMQMKKLFEGGTVLNWRF